MANIKEEWSLHRLQIGHFICTTILVYSMVNIADKTVSNIVYRRLRGWTGSGIRILVGERNLYLLQNVHIGSGAHPASD